MIYEFHAVGSMGFDGVVVKDGGLVATVVTEFPLDNVMSAIRMQKVTMTKGEPKPASKPVAIPTRHLEGIMAAEFGTKTTKGQAPPAGKAKKTKWSSPR